MYWSFNIRIKSTGAYENMWIYYITIVLNLHMFRSTFVVIYREVFFGRIYYKDNQINVQIQILSFKYGIHNSYM
jgi:hypothetical protein